MRLGDIRARGKWWSSVDSGSRLTSGGPHRPRADRIPCPTCLNRSLPKRRRKSLGSPTVERPRLNSGALGLARLGHSLSWLAQRHPQTPSASCRSDASPGSSSPTRMAAESLCAGTLSPKCSSSSPRPTSSTRPSSSSTLASSTQSGCRAESQGYAPTSTHMQSSAMPTTWLEPLAHEDRDDSSPVDALGCFLAREREQLQSAFLDLAGESRRPRTLSNLRHPALKALWWFASRRRQLPPTCEDVTD